MSANNSGVLVFEGCNFFRQRLLLATLSGKSIQIKNIRSKHDDPGIREFEASFIRLIDKITNGSVIEVSETGTALFYQPGFLIGGKIDHDCSNQRSIGYYLESLFYLAPFCKKPVTAVLRGITNDQIDPSVDSLKYGCLPVLKRILGSDEGLEIKLTRRGAAPLGGGEVIFKCPIRKIIKPIQFTDPGKIKRIRGVAYGMRVAPNTPNRMVESAKGVMLNFIPDVYINTDHCKGSQSGRSPGFGLVLFAETTTGAFLTAEMSSNPSGSDKGASIPEDLGVSTAHLLLEEIYRGGCLDSVSQSITCLFMALGQQDVSKILTGPLSPYTIQFLRHLKIFFKIMFKLESVRNEDSESQTGVDKVRLTCLGIGFSNLSKITT